MNPVYSTRKRPICTSFNYLLVYVLNLWFTYLTLKNRQEKKGVCDFPIYNPLTIHEYIEMNISTKTVRFILCTAFYGVPPSGTTIIKNILNIIPLFLYLSQVHPEYLPPSSI